VVPATQILNNRSVFGVSPEATEMLLEGERDFLLALLNPRLRIAQFKISRDAAARELEQFPEREALRKLAGKFHHSLQATG
jgi:hypothetical protein